MKLTNKTYYIVIIIGALALLSSLYLMLKGDPLQETIWGVVLGVSLIGSAIINSKKETN